MGWLEKGPSASLFVRYVPHRRCSSLTPRIQTLLKPTVGLLLMIRCTSLDIRVILPSRQLIVLVLVLVELELELELELESVMALPISIYQKSSTNQRAQFLGNPGRVQVMDKRRVLSNRVRVSRTIFYFR